MLPQEYVYPSAIAPTSGIIRVCRETAPDTFCAKFHFTAEIRKDGTAPTQRHFIRLAQFDGPTCKTGALRSLSRDIYHPVVLFSDAIDCCCERESRRKTLIVVDGLKEISEGSLATRLCELPVFRQPLPVTIVGVQVCSRLLISPFNLRYLNMRHQLAHDA